jgi:hypothetical protein
MGPAQIAGAGLVLGAIAAVVGDMILVLVAALWTRRSRRVALGAVAGAGLADAALIALGGWLGWGLVSVLGEPPTRATIAVGLFVGLAAKSLLGLLIGAWGVPADAELPARPLPTLARFGAIGLLSPTTGVFTIAAVVAWPRIWAFGGGWALAVGMIVGAAAARLGWAATERNRRGTRSARVERQGLRIVAIVILAALAVGALPR